MERNVHLVHVGKCAGESIIKALNRYGCKATKLHCGRANESIAEMVLRDDPKDFFVIAMRDPLKRFVSAFEWDLYEKILFPRKEIKNPLWTKIYDTFPTANALAEALSSEDETLREFADMAMKASRLHIQMDLAWYLPPEIAARLTPERAMAVRVEAMADDFKRVAKALNLPLKPWFSMIRTKDNYKGDMPPERLTKDLSETARENLRRYSARSYETMDILKASGVML